MTLRNLNRAKYPNTGLLIFKLILCIILFGPCYSTSLAQVVQSRSSGGNILFSPGMPVLELRILNPDQISNLVYPGMQFTINLSIKNIGQIAAEGCELYIESDSPFIFSQLSDANASIHPGDSAVQTVTFMVDREATPGHASIQLHVNEANGHNLHPFRIVNVDIQDAPANEILVTDYAIRDQSGIGYFDQFNDVQLFFRIQNCGTVSHDNIKTRIEPASDVIDIQLNPNMSLGTLHPGEYMDVSAVVSSGFDSKNIRINLSTGNDIYSIDQNFTFNFREDYKSPEQLSTDHCNQFISHGRNAQSESSDSITSLPAKSGQVNKFAIIISNKDYYSVEALDFASHDAQAFVAMLKSQLGFPQENIVWLPGLTREVFSTINENAYFDKFKRKLRRAKGPTELIFYYIGYGSNDFYSGTTYLLPMNFTHYAFESRINIDDVYVWLNEWKKKYKINHVTTLFNIAFHERSISGSKSAEEFQFVKTHNHLPGFTTMVSSSFHQSSFAGNPEGASLFTNYLIKGVAGAADLNGDKTISLFELHKFMADELKGIPAQARQLHNSHSVPFILGVDRAIY